MGAYMCIARKIIFKLINLFNNKNNQNFNDLQEKKQLQFNIIFLTRNGVPPSVSKRIQLGIDCKYSVECKNVEDLFIFTNAS